MPYKTKRVGSKSCVYKKDTGKKVGCTTGSVKKYLAALHINAHEDAPRKKMKSFKDYVEDLNTADGDQKITDDTTVTAEGLYAGSGGDQDLDQEGLLAGALAGNRKTRFLCRRGGQAGLYR